MNKQLAVLFALMMTAAGLHAATRRRASLPPAPLQPGACVARTYATSYSLDVAVDDAFVYYGDDLGNVFRISKDGGEPQLLAALTPETATLFALDDTTLFIMATDESGEVGSVVSIPKSGGTPLALVSGIIDPFAIALDDTSVYWVSLGSVIGGESFAADGSVGRVSKSGAGVTTLVGNLNTPTAVASDGTTVFFTEGGFSPFNTSAGLRSVPKNGGSVKSLANGSVVAVAVNGPNVIYESLDFIANQGELKSIPKSGGNSTSLSKGLDFVTKMIIAGDRLYIFDSGDADRIEWLPLTGGARNPVQGGTFLSTEFALDDCAVYFTDNDLNVRRTVR